MRNILLIEVSATLRHLLLILFRDHNYKVKVVPSYTEAITHIVDENDNVEKYDAIILGWPEKTDLDADNLFAALDEDSHVNANVIVLAHEADPGKVGWVTRRQNTAMVLWDDYRESVAALERITETDIAHKIIPTSLTAQEDTINILFVDDSPTMRVTYRKILEKNSYKVVTANSVCEGYEKVLSHNFDIAIIDYFMPDGTGDQLCAKIKENPETEHITCAILTGTYHDKVIRDSLNAGAVECMFKNEADALFLARISSMSRMKRVLISIQKDRNRLEGILSSVGDGVYGVSTEGIITFINPAALHILGFVGDSELVGKYPHAIFHNSTLDGESLSEFECPLNSVYESGQEYIARETIFRHSNGQRIYVECTVYPLMIGGEMEGSVVAFRDVTVRKLLQDELRWQATHDSLTKLANRYYFEEQLKTEVTRLGRSDERSALLYIDLDRFKYINDTAGHAAGDKLLLEIGQQLGNRLRSSDTLARIGGDEFAIILRNVDVETATETADMYRAALETYRFLYGGKAYVINMSIGLAMIDKQTKTHGDALANADLACFIAKGNGRNNTHVFVGTADEKSIMDKDLGWSVRLREALDNDLFKLQFQPIAPLQDLDMARLPKERGILIRQIGETPSISITHNEVLLRLVDSQGNLVAPDAFLPTAERFNMMNEIDRWVLNRALKILADVQNKGGHTCLSINISAQTLDDDTFADFVKERAEYYEVSTESLLFEITETSAIENMDAANRLIGGLRELGCKFALDDFGRGFCSFSYLKYLPVDYIKIDGIFVRGVLHDPIDKAIVNSVVQIAHSVGKKTIAEYVENVDVVRCLKKMGVDYVQGYYISRPKEEPEHSMIDADSNYLYGSGNDAS